MDDLNNMVLPPAVLAELYGGKLIDTGKARASEEPVLPPAETGPARSDKPEQAFRSLGNNQKNILVVVNNAGVAFMPDQELTFLTGILGACKLSLNDVAVVNFSQLAAFSYKELIHHFSSRIVLLFDVEPAAFGLPVNFPAYQLQPFAGNSFLYAPSLKDLENDRVEKSKLWVCLKRLFNI